MAACLFFCCGYKAEQPLFLVLGALLLSFILSLKQTKYLWLILIYVAGLYHISHNHKQNLFWQDFFLTRGMSELEFCWDNDVYLSYQDGFYSGWAKVRPIINNEVAHAYEKKLWVMASAQYTTLNPKCFKGHHWRSHVVTYHEEVPRSLRCALGHETSNSLSLLASIRKRVICILENSWQKHKEVEHCGIVRSLITGNRYGISQELKNNFGRLGLLPLLALSGLHVGIVFFCMRFLFKCIAIPPMIRDILLIFILLCYGTLGGWAYSLARATGMCIIYILANYFGRRYSIFNALFFMALAEMLINPLVVTQLSFSLSYLGVLGILWSLYITNLINITKLINLNNITAQRSIITKTGIYFYDIFRVSWGAMIWTWPIVLQSFHTIPIWTWIFSAPMFSLYAIVVITTIIILPFSLLGLSIPQFLFIPIRFYEELVNYLSNQFSWVNAWYDFDPSYMGTYFAGLIGIYYAARLYNMMQQTKKKSLAKLMA
ncbi:MAG: ComEC/Rec2 family competence protein [Planctomycetes bacterium]|nr:ComEC/Rec2 family competence protein [Planctomycetota bacterium]